MAGLLTEVGEQFSTVFKRFTFGQKLTIILVLLIAAGGIFGIVNWASRPDFVPLFSNLPPEDAGKIVDWLSENKIPYKLEQGGGRILVPREVVYNSRIRLAEEGLPSQRAKGYEIFDETNLGMSEFVQKINFRRALEGELARTIMDLDEVDEARVHIVIPEPALFREKENPATASVVLKLRGSLNSQQVAGVSHLISSAVEGLDTENVTIIDTRGNILSDYRDREPLMALSATQIQLKESVEKSLTEKVETMLSRLLGPTKSIVRVSVDLDFTHSEVTSEQYDPELTAIRSEESIERQDNTVDQNQVNPVDPTQPPLGSTKTTTETNNITNYEVSKTITRTTSQTGGIKRISAAVMVDGVYETVTSPEGETTQEYRPRSPEEMNKITEAVRSAIGYDDRRGDQLSVINIAFQTPPPEMPPSGLMPFIGRNWQQILQNLLLAAAIIGGLFYLRILLQRSSEAARVMMERRMAALPGRPVGALPGAVGEGGEPLALPDIDSELPPEVVEAQQLQQQIIEFVSEKPETAARLLKSWLVTSE